MSKAWMPMYWGDYKANTSELSMLEHGAYMQLIAHYWETGSPIPSSRRYRITGAKTKKEKEAVDFCLRFFFKSESSLDQENETVFFHKRIEEELDITAKKSGKARDSAFKRWAKHHANAYANASTQHMLERCETDANHNHNHNHNQVLSTNVAKTTPLTPLKGERSAYDETFNQFWDAYPRKTDKKKARDRWAKLNPDTELVAAILKAVKQQAASDQWRREGGAYIPHPTTWLNGERWTDEPSTIIAKPVHQHPAVGLNDRWKEEYCDGPVDRYGNPRDPVALAEWKANGKFRTGIL